MLERRVIPDAAAFTAAMAAVDGWAAALRLLEVMKREVRGGGFDACCCCVCGRRFCGHVCLTGVVEVT